MLQDLGALLRVLRLEAVHEVDGELGRREDVRDLAEYGLDCGADLVLGIADLV